MSSPAKATAPALRAHAACARLSQAMNAVIHGKAQAVRFAITTLAASGHLLIEDVPGVGKTTIAKALARSLGGTFRRIQFTSDLLPSDILGVTIFNQETQKFEFRPGPIFANVVLADEINRTTPRTQSSLLEAMAEGRVSLDNKTYSLTHPFIVLATQNPLEHFGTYPLPESQMDRFLIRIRMGYPSAIDERRIITATVHEDQTETMQPVVDAEDVAAIQQAASHVKVDESLLDYAERVVAETRRSQFLQLGISPRGFQGWFRAAKAFAFTDGRDYAVPDDFKTMAVPALGHRIVLAGAGPGDPLAQSRDEAERVVSEMLERVPVPA